MTIEILYASTNLNITYTLLSREPVIRSVCHGVQPATRAPSPSSHIQYSYTSYIPITMVEEALLANICR